MLRRIPFQASPQCRHLAGGQREAYRVGVPAKTGEHFGTAFKSLKQMEVFNGPAGAVGLTILVRNHKRRFSGCLDDARRQNADHAAMPAFAVEHQAACLSKLRALQLPEHFLECIRFRLPPLRVQPVQLRGKLFRARGQARRK